VVTETVSKLLVDETTVALEARETLCASVHRARIRISSSAPFSSNFPVFWMFFLGTQSLLVIFPELSRK
jgi:hypothetical protein